MLKAAIEIQRQHRTCFSLSSWLLSVASPRLGSSSRPQLRSHENCIQDMPCAPVLSLQLSNITELLFLSYKNIVLLCNITVCYCVLQWYGKNTIIYTKLLHFVTCPDSSLLSQAATDIQRAFTLPNSKNFQPTWMLVVTWSGVTFSTASPSIVSVSMFLSQIHSLVETWSRTFCLIEVRWSNISIFNYASWIGSSSTVEKCLAITSQNVKC